jgi:hypothetical protein
MRNWHGSYAFILAAAFGTAVACGGGQPPAQTPPPEPTETAAPPATEAPPPASEAPAESAAPTASESAETPPAKPVWQDMTEEQRAELMKKVVIPKLGADFKELDAKKYAEVKCKLCHGEDAKERKFKMPNPKLPVLDPAGGFAKHKKKNPKMFEFMTQKVLPDMAEALGMETFDPETKKGFGCGGCHTMAGGKPPPAAAKAKKP